MIVRILKEANLYCLLLPISIVFVYVWGNQVQIRLYASFRKAKLTLIQECHDAVRKMGSAEDSLPLGGCSVQLGQVIRGEVCLGELKLGEQEDEVKH